MENNSAADSVDTKVAVEPKNPASEDGIDARRNDALNQKLSTSQQPLCIVDLTNHYYDVTHKQRGLAIIINNFQFDCLNVKEQNGLEMDLEQLKITFQYLGFDVKTYNECTQNRIEEILRKAAEMDHRNNDCIAVVVRSDGNTQEELWKPFLKCQSLVGKPKLFFIQVYHDLTYSKTIGDLVDSRSDEPQNFQIPTMADLLVMSYEEYFGSLNRDKETGFVHALCKELAENGTNDDLLRLLTGVNRRVAVRLQSNESDNENRTMPSIVSTLTKNLHFVPKVIRLCTSQQDGSSENALQPAAGSECTSQQTAGSLCAYYDMMHEKRGLAIIFNHLRFDSLELPDRIGTEKDQKRLEKTFRKLGFDVKTYIDRTTNQINEILQKAADVDHRDNDCIVVIVLSHGGIISQLDARDGNYAVDELWKPILNSPSLIGKPKLFFIQACRGKNTDPGLTVISKDPKGDDVDSASAGCSSQYFKVPFKADLLVMYATYEGHYAFRNPYKGSVFIQTLCDELDANGAKDDLFHLLTGVNRRVAYEFQAIAPEDPRLNDKKQMPTIVSMLTKTLYFTEKESLS